MVKNNSFKMQVPDNVQREEINLLVDIIRQTPFENGRINSDEMIKIIEIKPYGAINEVKEVVFLLFTVPSVWFTKKWIDEYLWPKIKENIDKPSQALSDWIFSLLENLKKQSTSEK